MTSFSKKQTLKNGRTLKVIHVSRISTVNQDELCLDDQQALHRDYVKDHIHSGATEYTDIASQGSGEILDCEELERLEELIKTGIYDLVICEDLARICRRAMAIYFCELCEDHDTRLVAINDRVDTSEDGWRDSAFISTWHHERSNIETSERIKRSLPYDPSSSNVGARSPGFSLDGLPESTWDHRGPARRAIPGRAFHTFTVLS